MFMFNDSNNIVVFIQKHHLALFFFFTSCLLCYQPLRPQALSTACWRLASSPCWVDLCCSANGWRLLKLKVFFTWVSIPGDCFQFSHYINFILKDAFLFDFFQVSYPNPNWRHLFSWPLLGKKKQQLCHSLKFSWQTGLLTFHVCFCQQNPTKKIQLWHQSIDISIIFLSCIGKIWHLAFH